jgi:hypothetical protein
VGFVGWDELVEGDRTRERVKEGHGPQVEWGKQRDFGYMEAGSGWLEHNQPH